MEHSALHAIQLTATLLVLAGPLLVLGLLTPLATSPKRSVGLDDGAIELLRGLRQSAARVVRFAALAGAVAALADLAVAVAEIEGRAVFGGVDPRLVTRFAWATTAGRLAMTRILCLLACAVLAGMLRRREPGEGALAWWGIGALALTVVGATTQVSHAAAQPEGRALLLTLQALHLIAGAAWIGVLVHLFAARHAIVAATSPAAIEVLGRLVDRFSPFALGAASLIAGSGAWSAWTYLRTPGAVLTSAYGLTLLVKLGLLAPLLAAAWTNWRVIRPALAALRTAARARRSVPDDDPIAPRPVLRQFVLMLELEVTAGLLVIAVAGIVGSIAPPGEDGAGRITAAEMRVMLTPKPPATRIADPATWVGSATRTEDDLRYSEFMHNWSGIGVILLGLAWLAQSLGGRVGHAIGRLWPLALLPFAVFVAVMSDPEVWPLGAVSPWVALTDPVVLEHRIGAAMILVLAWLGWREERRAAAAVTNGGAADSESPLGKPLPLLMILGSLLLLGHGHSSLASTESLTTRINAQHVVLGGLGLLAGVVRWLQLRGLVPDRAARWVWPGLVVMVGVVMGLFYREVV